MRAAIYRSTGPASDVLELVDLDQPEPGPGQVLVEIVISAINPTDVKTRAGLTPRPIDGFQVPHVDGVGTIIGVGPGVDAARLGERVWVFLASVGNRWGTAAEYCMVSAEQAVPLPAEASWELGACFGVPALTAVQMLCLGGSIDGKTVLVQGGTGAVGHFAIQLARWMGATVIATAGTAEKAAQVVETGAHAGLCYRDADFVDQVRAIGPVDLITEVSLVDNWESDLAVLRHRGSIVTYATDARPLTMPLRPAMVASADLRFYLLYADPRESLLRGALLLDEAARAGALTALPIHAYALDDIVRAHERVEALEQGKTVLDLRLAAG